MRLFEEMRGSAWTGPPPAITRPRRNSTLAPIGGVPAYCQQLVVETGVKVLVDPLTQRRTFDGVVRVTNKGRDVAALDRVGVRLCSRMLDHPRVRADCPIAEELAPADVLPGTTIVCTWQIELPAPPAPGASEEEWTGVFSSVLVALYGDRCPSSVVDPSTGAVGGTCSARDA